MREHALDSIDFQQGRVFLYNPLRYSFQIYSILELGEQHREGALDLLSSEQITHYLVNVEAQHLLRFLLTVVPLRRFPLFQQAGFLWGLPDGPQGVLRGDAARDAGNCSTLASAFPYRFGKLDICPALMELWGSPEYRKTYVSVILRKPYKGSSVGTF